jgi:hypothetical protein
MKKVVDDKVFSKEEIAFLKSLNTPRKVQDFLDTVEYNKGRRLSIAEVFRKKIGDCIESACFASYVLSLNKIDNFLMDLYCFDDADHVICVYKKNGLYGSVANSLYIGLRGKSPVYRNLRELALAYFEHFFTYEGILDLRKYSVPIKFPNKLTKKYRDWIFSKRFMCDFEVHVDTVKHIFLVPKDIKLENVSKDTFQREFVRLPSNAKIAKEYLDVIKNTKRI